MSERKIIKYDKNRDINEYNTEDELGNKYFEALGKITFCHTNEGLKYFIQSAEETPAYISNENKANYIQLNKEMHYQKWISDIMSGKSFFEAVDAGCFIDYDGTLSCIYVDGYLSNLGLCHGGICQGEFLVDGDTFQEICKNHHVLVDWANK